jgi:hypothetical protein
MEKEKLLKEIEILSNNVLLLFYKSLETATAKQDSYEIESITKSFNMYSKLHDKILRGFNDDKSI